MNSLSVISGKGMFHFYVTIYPFYLEIMRSSSILGVKMYS